MMIFLMIRLIQMKRIVSMMSDFIAQCFYLASLATVYPQPHRVDTCLEIAHESIKMDIDPYLAISLAYHESRLDKSVVSSAGAVGAMQVMRRFIDCKNCTDIQAGLIALRYWLNRSSTVCDALGRYIVGSAGKCGKSSKAIIALSRDLKCAGPKKKDFCYEC
jgi:hypothetical protein